MGIVIEASKENCSHVMFDLERRELRGGVTSAYFLTAEPQDLPSDAKNIRQLKIGDVLSIEVDGKYAIVHTHEARKDDHRLAFGYPFVESTRVSRGIVAAWIFRLQHPRP